MNTSTLLEQPQQSGLPPSKTIGWMVDGETSANLSRPDAHIGGGMPALLRSCRVTLRDQDTEAKSDVLVLDGYTIVPTEDAVQPDDFDKWQANPYTKALQKSISEDYVPKHAAPQRFRRFHVGCQNDGLYIISGAAPVNNNDYPNHEADRTCIAKVWDEAEARRLVAAANAGIEASQPSPPEQPKVDE